MERSENKFFLASAMMLAAAIIFAASLYLHDTRPAGASASSGTTPTSAIPGAAANAPLPSDGTTVPVMGLVQNINGDHLTMESNGNAYSVVVNAQTTIDERSSQSDPTKYTDIPLSSVQPGSFILVTSLSPFATGADVTAKTIELVVAH